MIPQKTGLIECAHCALPCKNEHVRLTHRFIGRAISSETDFCSNECMKEFLYERGITAAIEKEVNRRVKELADRLWKQICPSCHTETNLCPSCRIRHKRLREEEAI